MVEKTGLKEELSLELSRGSMDLGGKLKFRGLVELEVHRDGRLLRKIEVPNTIAAALLNAVADAMGGGAMTAVSGIDFYYGAAWGHAEATSIDGGGTGAEAWTRWKATLVAAATISVTPVRLGVKSGSALTTVYSEVAITTVTLSSGDSLIVKWTITAATS